MINLVNHLESIIHRFTSTKPVKSAWSLYYEETILGQEYLKQKERVFIDMIQDINIDIALDIGGNDGYFSKILSNKSVQVVTIDTDSQSISNLYQYTKKRNDRNILPLCVDVTNPSPALGFDHRERLAFEKRIKPDLVLALALIHHLLITKNIPLEIISKYFHSIAENLIIEFVPKYDEKVKEMLSNRKDIFGDYNISHFESVFQNYFTISKKQQIKGTDRFMYLMVRKK